MVVLEGILQAETEAAILLSSEDLDPDDSWIPKSQINDWDDFTWERGDWVEIEISEWIAKKKGIDWGTRLWWEKLDG